MKLRVVLATAVLATVGTGLAVPALAGAPSLSPPPPHRDNVCVYQPDVLPDGWCVNVDDLQVTPQR